MQIYEVLWFESYTKLGSIMEVKQGRIGLFKIKRDANEAGMEHLQQKDSGLVNAAYHYESSPDGTSLVFRSNLEGYEEHRYSYRIDEVELQ